MKIFVVYLKNIYEEIVSYDILKKEESSHMTPFGFDNDIKIVRFPDILFSPLTDSEVLRSWRSFIKNASSFESDHVSKAFYEDVKVVVKKFCNEIRGLDLEECVKRACRDVEDVHNVKVINKTVENEMFFVDIGDRRKILYGYEMIELPKGFVSFEETRRQ